MKKCVFVFLLIAIIILLGDKVFALSDNFLFIIDTVGIPRYNTYGHEISEEVYNAYNIFSYSEPHKVTNQKQRWKNSKYGYWAKGKGIYTGSGTRGEYYILGYSYSGAEIYNYYFPMDVIPTTTPDKWVFYTYPAAQSSWSDNAKYKYEEQLTHMLNSKLMFNDISSRARADNPKYIKEYNITAGEIGKNLARLDTAATWKTYGMISTMRKISGVVYQQVYLVKPMAADAKAVCDLDAETNWTLTEEQDEVIIPIEYRVSVENMTGYANVKHIKELKVELHINGEKVDEISGSKITSKGNEYMLVITRDKFPPRINHKIELKIYGYVHTEFAVDGLMQDTKSKSINVYVEPKKVIPVKETNVMLLEKYDKKWVVSPLAQNIETNNKNSIGFIEAGKYIALRLNMAVDNFENIDIYLGNNLLKSERILEENKKIILKTCIPEQTDATLFGFTSLRDNTGSYFTVDVQNIGTRKKEPYTLRIVVTYGGKNYETEILIDVLDCYVSNINTIIDINNYNEVMVKTNLEEWIHE